MQNKSEIARGYSCPDLSSHWQHVSPRSLRLLHFPALFFLIHVFNVFLRFPLLPYVFFPALIRPRIAVFTALHEGNGDDEDDDKSKINSYFASEILDCLDLFPVMCSGEICNGNIQFQLEIRKISGRRSRSSDDVKHRHFTFLCCSGRQKNVERSITRVNACTLNFLFGDVLVAVLVFVVCLSPLID